MPIDILREAETDLAELAGLPGAIRDKVKNGVAELKRLHGAIDAEIVRLTGGAQATLEALRAMAPAPGRPEGEASPPPIEDGKPSPAF